MPGTRTTRTRLLLPLLLALCGAGCSAPGYVMEQAWGQLKMLHGRQRLVDLIRSPDLTPERRWKMKLVLEVRRYAHQELGLRQTAAYTRFYDTSGAPMAYNLSACPKDSLKPKVWRFPIVGGLPYIGFFKQERGRAMQRTLDAQGLDTYLRPVSAFSSLGWFADPVYSSMLVGDVSRLVDVIIHETTHTTIFLRDQVAFNESLAVFVGNQGALNFLARLYGPHSPQVREHRLRISRRRRFSLLVTRLYNELTRLYGSTKPRAEKLRQREVLFTQAQQQYKEIFPDPAQWGSFARRPLNNAILLSYGRYNQGLDFHHLVYRALGRDLRRLVELYRYAQQFDDPISYVAGRYGLRWFTKQRM